jgi:hypothetical protein
MAESIVALQTTDSPNIGVIEDFTLTAADSANGNSFVNNGKTRFLIKNSHSGSLDVVFRAYDDPLGRSPNWTVSTAAGKESWVGPFPPFLWNSPTGIVRMIIADDTALWLAAVSDK